MGFLHCSCMLWVRVLCPSMIWLLPVFSLTAHRFGCLFCLASQRSLSKLSAFTITQGPDGTFHLAIQARSP